MKERFRVPGEWERHEACWLAFPHLAEEWPLGLPMAQRSIASLCLAIAGPGNEPVRLLVRDADVERQARALLGNAAGIEYVPAAYGDCWLRDTLPLLGHDTQGRLHGLRFRFNGWGGKYEMPFDDSVGDWWLDRLGARAAKSKLFLEGGALDSNGGGTFLTTESCALNPNRNPGLTREAFELMLGELCELRRVIWLERGLRHDHTDGHVDMIARFASADTVLSMRPTGDVPNAGILRMIAGVLRDEGLSIVEIPAPSALADIRGAPLPASYCNFYVANGAVIVPTYGLPEDDAALEAIGHAFQGREVIGLPARDLLCGGGAFHCATQPEPHAP
ncbi:MAG: agmatine deiminase family protein [Polyangiales bacterium]